MTFQLNEGKFFVKCIAVRCGERILLLVHRNHLKLNRNQVKNAVWPIKLNFSFIDLHLIQSDL